MGKILGKYKVLLVTIVLLLLTACSAIAELDEHVVMVKTGHPELYPELEYGEVFGEFFGNPAWEYFKSDENQDIVQFTGTCKVLDKKVNAEMQFILDTKNDSFEVGALTFNDIPQIQFMTMALISKAFETYADNHNIELAKKSDDMWNFDDYVNYEDTEKEKEDTEPQTNNTVPPATVVYET